MNKQILCAYDGSRHSEKAFDYALALASAFGGKLHVLAVAQPPDLPEDVETEAMIENAEERFEASFAKLRARASAKGVDADFGVAVGHPAEQILYRADEVHADQIVLGHRGKNFFERWLLGSVTHRVIAYATTAVTVVR